MSNILTLLGQNVHDNTLQICSVQICDLQICTQAEVFQTKYLQLHLFKPL